MKNNSTLSVSEGVQSAVETLLSTIANDLNTEKRIEQIYDLLILKCGGCGSHNFSISATHTLKATESATLKGSCENCEIYGAGYRSNVYVRYHTLLGKLHNPKQIEWSDIDGFFGWIDQNADFFEQGYKDMFSKKTFTEYIECPECFNKGAEPDWEGLERDSKDDRYDVNYTITCDDCEHHFEFGVETEYKQDNSEIVSYLNPFELDYINPIFCVPLGDYLENWLRNKVNSNKQNDRFLAMVQSHMKLIKHNREQAIIEKSHIVKL